MEETLELSSFDLDTDNIKFLQPIKIQAQVSKITNAVTVELTLRTAMQCICSRCLEEFETDFKKDLRLSYLVTQSQRVIDLSQDIREEIVLEYPIKPLCKAACNGLCVKCGANLNQGKCMCKNPEE